MKETIFFKLKGTITSIIGVMGNEGYDFEGDDIHIDGRSLFAQGFIELINSLMNDA